MHQQIVERIFHGKVILYLFLYAGLIIGIINYIQVSNPIGDDPVIAILVNAFTYKILDGIFVAPHPAILIIPASLVMWSTKGFLAYLVGKAAVVSQLKSQSFFAYYVTL